MLKKLYVGRICPILEYGMAASSTAAKYISSKLSRLQHQAMRMMTGAMQSTHMSAMETVTDLQATVNTQKTSGPTQTVLQWRLPYMGEMCVWGGGGEVNIRYNDRKTHITIATGKYSTNLKQKLKLSKNKSCN